jgi:cytidine deaminase
MVRIDASEKRLLDAALKAMHEAYVLWGFKVGAAVLGSDGKIYEGCNVESWVSGLGTCAERCAIDHAVLHGNQRVKEVAIIMDASSHNEPKPCGACLQYINDFAENRKIKIVMAKAEKGEISFETVKVNALEEMLPFPFRK